MRRSVAVIAVMLSILPVTAGCRGSRAVRPAGLPKDYEIRTAHLVIRSDVQISQDDPLLLELEQLRTEIVQTLALPSPTRPVVVHLFEDEQRYTRYMKAAFPNLPLRRAFFIGSPTELAVYAHWGDNVEEDLRHEYTHGILHASLRTVPLWLDEGLAEYFEISSPGQKRLHPEHTHRLALAIQNGWKPDLGRLERMEDVSQMQRADYQEAWAWVHYLLHELPGGRELLTDYLASLKRSDKAPSLAMQLRSIMHDPELRLASYVSGTLQVTVD